jgi:CheY-specific phosphatase CheX
MLNNLASTISNVIEELALMMVETPEQPMRVPSELAGHIEFAGSVHGRLSATSTEALGVSLASNLLGLPSDDPETREKALDAFGEMLNIITGNLVTELFGTQNAFSLSIPVCRRVEPAPTDGTVAPTPAENAEPEQRWSLQEKCTLLLDEQPIEFVLSVALGKKTEN